MAGSPKKEPEYKRDDLKCIALLFSFCFVYPGLCSHTLKTGTSMESVRL